MPSAPDASREPQSPPPPKEASFLQVVGAVLWSFFGIRRRAAMSRDVTTIKPLHIVVAGVALGAIFVLTLIVLVQVIVRSVA